MSKFLNRIAPQDEVLLETDIGTMIPSAEQLAEERVTRFNADKEIRLRVKALEESGSAIEEAKAAAEQASKAAQQAEDAKEAIGDVGERLDKVDDRLEQIPIAESITYRDVMGELQKAKGWSDAYMALFAIKSCMTSASGNLVIYSTYNADNHKVYVLSKNGAILAEETVASGKEYYDNSFQYLVRLQDCIILVNKSGEVFDIVEDGETASIVKRETPIDFNGLITTLEAQIYEANTNQFAIGNLLVLGAVVINLDESKVVQILPSRIVSTTKTWTSADGSVFVTLANGEVYKCTVGADGLLALEAMTKFNGRVVVDDSPVITSILPKSDALSSIGCEIAGMVGYASRPIPSSSIVAIVCRNKTIVMDTYTNGIIAYKISTSNVSDHNNALRIGIKGTIASGIMRIGLRFLGVDNGGVWIAPFSKKELFGRIATDKLVRVNF